jgi:hypothetical protein
MLYILIYICIYIYLYIHKVNNKNDLNYRCMICNICIHIYIHVYIFICINEYLYLPVIGYIISNKLHAMIQIQYQFIQIHVNASTLTSSK